MVATEEFDRRLPEERGARVTLALEDGSMLVSEVPNPVGDVAHEPFGLRQIREKLEPLLGARGNKRRGRSNRRFATCSRPTNVNEALEGVP